MPVNDEIEMMIREMYHVVIGTEHDPESSLISRVKRTEKTLEEHKAIITKVTWGLIGLSAPAGWGIIDLLIKIFVK